MPEMSAIAELASPAARRLAVDARIDRHRTQADPENVTKRATPRLSISELNSLDIDQVRQRFVRSKSDTRTPFVKFLDLIDLPRSAVLNGIASFTVPELRRTEDRAAAGLARINFSDFLREMGVENRVVRGVLGFVGDVGLDPLTYAGGVGIGLQVAGKSGNVARIGLSGGRQLRRGIRATAKGGQAASPVVRDLIQSVGVTPARVQRAQNIGLSPSQIETVASRRIMGDAITGQSIRNLITPRGATDGLLSKAVDAASAASEREAKQLAAAKKFISEFGVGTRGIGPAGGTTVARVPFTDLAARIPAITSGAQSQRAALAVASAGVVPEAFASGDLLRHASDVRRSVDEGERLLDRIVKVEDSIESSRVLGGITTAREAELGRARAELDDLVGTARESAEASSDALNRMGPIEIADADPGKLAALSQQMRAQQAMVDRLAKLKDRQFSRSLDTLRRRLVGTRDRRIAEEFNRIQDALEAGDLTPQGFREAGVALLRSHDDALRETSERLANMSDIDARASIQLADIVSDHFTTATNLADSLQASVMAFLTHSDRRLVEAAKQQLGLGEAAHGPSLFTPIKLASQSVFGDTEFGAGVASSMAKLERGLRRNFGVHEGRAGEVTGALRFAGRRGQDRVADAVARSIGEPVGQVLRRHGLNPFGQDGQDANDLLHILAYTRRDEELRAAGRRGIIDRFVPNTPEAVKRRARKAGTSLDPELAKWYTPLYRRSLEIRQRSFGRAGLVAQVGEDLKPVVDDVLRLMDEAGEVAQSERLVASLAPGYIPKAITALARESIGQQQTLTSFRKPGEQAARGLTELRESFTKPRTTTLYRFRIDDDLARKHGVAPGEYEFYEFERDWLRHQDKLEFIRANYGEQYAAEIAKKQNIVVAFDDFALSQGIDRASQHELLGKPADTFRLNQDFSDGLFRPLATPEEIGPFLFETDVPRLIGDRIAQQYAMQSRQKLRELARSLPLTTKVDALASRRSGPIVFTNGMRGTVVSGPGQRQAVRIGDQVYRQLDADLVGRSDSALVEGLRGEGHTAFWPEEVADAIENTARVLQPQNHGDVVRAVDGLTNAWKAVTLFHPSWMLTNMIGGVFQAMQGSLSVGQSLARHAPTLTKAAINLRNRQWLGENFIEIAGRGHVRLSDLVDDAVRGRVVGAARTDNVFLEMVRDGRYRPFTTTGGTIPQRVAGTAQQAARGFREDFGMSAQAYARAAGRQAQSHYDRIRATNNVVFSERMIRRVLAPWFGFNSRVEDSLRLGAYVGHLERGLSHEQAAAMVRKTLFDYDDLTTTERQIFRRVFPWYSWVRFSGAYQLRQMLENPAVAALAPKLKENIEEAMVGEAAIPEQMRPMWMREAMAVQVMDKPGKEFGVLTSTMLPTETALQVGSGLTQGGSGVQDLLHYFTNMVNPIISTGPQIGTGREFFTGRTIGDPNQADLSRTEFLAGQARPFRELGIGQRRGGALQNAAEQGPFNLVSRMVLGGRGQIMAEDRIGYHRLRELQDLEQGIRRAINLRQREGQDSTQLRAELLRLYEQFIEAGHEDEVPRWAIAQLQQIASKANP